MTDQLTFERELASAFERYLVAAPTAVDAVVLAQHVARRPIGRRRVDWSWARRGLLSPVGVVALLVITLAAAAAFGALPQLVPVQPSPSPTPTILPATAEATAPGPAPTPSATVPAGPLLSSALRSTWVASAGSPPSPSGTRSLVRLVASPSGDRLSIFEAGVERFASRAANEVTTELDLISTATAGGCQVGDSGRYAVAFGSDGTIPGGDGTFLVLDAIEDHCAARASALGRRWVHAIDADSNGGRGIATSFQPMFLITLPQAASSMGTTPGPDALLLDQPDRSLTVARNPLGYVVPSCGLGEERRPIEPTIAAWTDYLRTFPGFTVETAPLQVDGHPAVILTIPTTQTAECPSHLVKLWFTADGTNFGWHVQQGDTDVLGLVEVDGSVFLFQWYPFAGTRDRAQAVLTREMLQALLATVRFTDSLPQ
jgi:hypothetical protein